MAAFACIRTSDRYMSHKIQSDSDMVRIALIILLNPITKEDYSLLECVMNRYGASFDLILNVAKGEAGEEDRRQHMSNWSETIHLLETFNVFYNCCGLDVNTKVTKEPLTDLKDALCLANNLSQREGMTEVWIVCVQDNMTLWHWKEGKVIFPPNGALS